MTDCQYKIPITLKEPIQRTDGQWTYQISVPCGKCTRCIERRKLEWAFRIEQEMYDSKIAYFVTLTYSPETVPYTNYGIKTLTPHKDVTELVKIKGKKRRVRRKRDDLVKFWKRLRINEERKEIPTWENLYNNLLPTDKIRFYAVGEYGEEKGRPHYHAIIFNASRVMIERSWDLGSTHIVLANKQTIAYLMKYLDKWMGKKQDWKKTPEYNSMSEGIGLSYIAKNQLWHKQNLDVLFVTNNLGFKIPMPRIYRLKIFSDEERLQQILIVEEALKDQKQEMILEHGEDGYSDIMRETKKYDEVKFKKSIKKRIID